MYTIKLITEFEYSELDSFIKNRISNFDHKIFISKNFKKNNFSFVLSKDNEIKAFCPISYEKKLASNKEWKIGTFFGISLPGIIVSDKASIKELRLIISTILKEIDKICLKNSFSHIKICFSDFVNFDLNSLRFQILSRLLLEYHYLNISMIGNRIDLKKDFIILANSISKGHKAILKNSNYSLDYYDNEKKKLNYNNFFSLINLVMPNELSGNQEYITYLYGIYKKNYLEIVDVYDGKEKIAVAVFAKINKTVEYFHSRKINESKNAHHFLILDAIKKYKKQDFNFLNLGVVSYGPQLHYIPSKKHLNVSIFKRGFKGDNYPLVIYEKYFSKNFFEENQRLRIKNFSSLINE